MKNKISKIQEYITKEGETCCEHELLLQNTTSEVMQNRVYNLLESQQMSKEYIGTGQFVYKTALPSFLQHRKNIISAGSGYIYR